MADISVITAGIITPMDLIGQGRQHTVKAGEAIVAGAPVYLDATTGLYLNSDANGAGKDIVDGIASRTVAAGEALTIYVVAILDGYDLSGLNYRAPVYLSNTVGRLSDSAGGTSIIIGRVYPVYATNLGVAPDKLLEVRL